MVTLYGSQDKRNFEIICHSLPLYSNFWLPWWSSNQVLTRIDLRSDKVGLPDLCRAIIGYNYRKIGMFISNFKPLYFLSVELQALILTNLHLDTKVNPVYFNRVDAWDLCLLRVISLLKAYNYNCYSFTMAATGKCFHVVVIHTIKTLIVMYTGLIAWQIMLCQTALSVMCFENDWTGNHLIGSF